MNSELIETPNFEGHVEALVRRYHSVLQEQIFLQEQGVSFSYSDTLVPFDRIELVNEYQEFIEEKNKRIQEARARG